MADANTSVRVSRHTIEELERLQQIWHTRSADETIQQLVKERRLKAIKQLYGSSPDLPPFTEADHLDSHY